METKHSNKEQVLNLFQSMINELRTKNFKNEDYRLFGEIFARLGSICHDLKEFESSAMLLEKALSKNRDDLLSEPEEPDS